MNLFFNPFFVQTDFFHTFATVLVSRLPTATGGVMKSESGANPEQTRCCKFLSKSLNTLQATVRHRMGRHSKTEQVRRPAKTNIVLKLSGNKATKHRVKSFFIPLHKDIISPCVYSLKQVMNTISRIKMKVFVHVFLLLVCLSQLSLTAQNKITLSGKVTDQQGTPLSLVTIAVENTVSGTYTDDSGLYSLQVSPGKHTFVVSSLGYQTIKTSLDLHHDKTLDFKLEESSVSISPVEVYGKTQSQQVRESALSVNALDVKPVINSLNSLNELVNRTSGVKIREEGGVGSDFDLSINGLSGNSVRYFIDGVPLDSKGSYVTLTNLPVNLIDRVEIYKGVVPASLGTDALGGAVNIITQAEKKSFMDASYSIGSFHTHRANLNAQFMERHTGLVVRPAIGISYSKNDYRMKDVQMRNETGDQFIYGNPKRFHDGYFSLLAQIEAGITGKFWADEFFVSASYSKTDKELQTGSIQTKVYGMAERNSDAWNVSVRYNKYNFMTEGMTLKATLSHTWDHSITIDTAYRKYYWDGGYIVSQRNEIRGNEPSIRHYKRPLTIVRVNLDYQLDGHHGLNLNYHMNRTGNDRYDDLDQSFEPSNDAVTKHIIGLTYSQSFFDGKMQNIFFAKDYVNHPNIRQTDQSTVTGSDKVQGSTTKNYFGYGTGLRYMFFDPLAVKVSYEHSVRLPIARELLGNGTTIYANVALKPEKSNNVNLALFGTWHPAGRHTIYYEANGFLRYVDNYIQTSVIEKEGMMQFVNDPAVHIKGVEGEIRYDWDGRLQLMANVSYQDARDQQKYKEDGKPSATYDNHVPNRPWLFGNAEASYTFHNLLLHDNKLRLGCTFQWVHWYFLTWEAYGNRDTKARIPSQHICNANITYSWKHDSYNISLECSNFLDETAYDNYKLQKPGRAFFAKFRVFIN